MYLYVFVDEHMYMIFLDIYQELRLLGYVCIHFLWIVLQSVSSSLHSYQFTLLAVYGEF